VTDKPKNPPKPSNTPARGYPGLNDVFRMPQVREPSAPSTPAPAPAPKRETVRTGPKKGT
jgi:hypothetical protein